MKTIYAAKNSTAIKGLGQKIAASVVIAIQVKFMDQAMRQRRQHQVQCADEHQPDKNAV